MDNMENVKFCQSCSMPMSTEEVYGTEVDGGKNDEYCMYCYQNGAFTSPDETLENMIATSVPFMVEDNPDLTEDQARDQLMAVLPKLKRWKQ